MIVNGFQPLTVVTKRSIWDVTAVLDTPVNVAYKNFDLEDAYFIIPVYTGHQTFMKISIYFDGNSIC